MRQTRWASEAQDIIAVLHLSSLSVVITVVDRIPAARTFRASFEATGRPLLIRGGVSAWAAIDRWSIDSLADYVGDQQFELEHSPSCLFDPNESDPATKLVTHTLNYKDAVPLLKNPEDGAYYIREADLSCVGSILGRDIESIPVIPRYTRTFPPKLWVGSALASSPIHYDGGDYNFLAHVSGVKMFRMFPPSETGNLYPNVSARLPHLSKVSHINPDLQAFPRYACANYSEVDLYPGDLLFVPRNWWHCTTSKTATISVNFFWQRSWMSRSCLSLLGAVGRSLP